MISSAQLLKGLSDIGISRFTGVPCSYFSGPIALATSSPEFEYEAAVNEGTAISSAAGAYLAGAPTAVFMQNSGFGNIVNPLTSLLLPYELPVLVFISMRGWPSARSDEPQHHWMGKLVPDWLRSLDIEHEVLSPEPNDLSQTLERARLTLQDGKSFFVLVGKDAIAGEPSSTHTQQVEQGIARSDLVAAVIDAVDDSTPVLSTTGFMSRELFAARDRDLNFYMQGSMGHLAAISLGIARHSPSRKVVLLDGDGAVLMHAGSLANLAGAATHNVVHVVFNNGLYASTGGQSVVTNVDFALLGESLGYRSTWLANDQDLLRAHLKSAMSSHANTLIVVTGGRDVSSAGGRAFESISAGVLAERFRTVLLREPDEAEE